MGRGLANVETVASGSSAGSSSGNREGCRRYGGPCDPGDGEGRAFTPNFRRGENQNGPHDDDHALW